MSELLERVAGALASEVAQHFAHEARSGGVDRPPQGTPLRDVSTHHEHLPAVGLGLALVRDVVSALGGRIEVASAVGRGSTFTVALPADGPTEAQA